MTVPESDARSHTQSEHRFPTPSSKLPELEGALFISAQLSTDAVSALRKVWVLVKLQDCGSNSTQARM